MPPSEKAWPQAPALELIKASDESTAASNSDAAQLLDGMYRAEAGKLATYFRRRLRGDDEPGDYVHEVFARFASQLSKNAVSQPYHYLRRIAQNLVFERSRRLKARVTFNYVPLSVPLEPAVPPDQTHRLDMEDALNTCRQALSELPSKTREVFLLHRVEDLHYREIGERLGISVPTVQYHMARALAHIDAALGQE